MLEKAQLMDPESKMSNSLLLDMFPEKKSHIAQELP